MTVSSIDKQINNYLAQLNEKQKKAVLTVVKTFAEEQESNLNESSFIEEMDKRIEELESGKVAGRTWEEVKQSARKSISKENK